MTDPKGTEGASVHQPKRYSKREARQALPQELRETFDKLCEETLAWSQYYYGSSMISYSIIKELVEDGWTKLDSKK